MSTIRLGVVGYGGRIGGVIREPLRGAYPSSIQPDIRIVGIVDPDEDGARRTSGFTTLSTRWSARLTWTG